jgi:peptidoglycan L-alanyl-D-glutamate endopeptidase CwlK
VTLNGRSIANLAGVHPDLVRVVLRAAADGARFIVTEGVRSQDRQVMLVAAGKSRTLQSRHLHGFAVDLAVITLEGEVSWRRDDYKMLATQVKATAHELGVPIRWGGDWVSIVDCPHFELPKEFYPDPPLDLSKDEKESFA